MLQSKYITVKIPKAWEEKLGDIPWQIKTFKKVV